MLTLVFSVLTVLCAHAKVTRYVGLSEKTFRYREHVCIYLYGIAIYEVYIHAHTDSAHSEVHLRQGGPAHSN